jgi:predicted transcriptional regulator YheO
LHFKAVVKKLIAIFHLENSLLIYWSRYNYEARDGKGKHMKFTTNYIENNQSILHLAVICINNIDSMYIIQKKLQEINYIVDKILHRIYIFRFVLFCM